MIEKEEYSLNDAVKQFYTVEPLKIKLPEAVEEKIFAKQRNTAPARADLILYAFAGLLMTGGGVYCITMLAKTPFYWFLLIIVPIGFFMFLSLKEVQLLRKKILSA